MKKINLYIVLLLLSSIFFCGCGYNSVLNPKKPFNFYYTNLLAKNLTLESSYKCVIKDTNYYREKHYQSLIF